MLRATFRKYTLNFKRPGGTSRGVLHEKDSYFIFLRDDRLPVIIGIGECGLLRGLSHDDRPDYEEKLAWACAEAHRYDQLIDEELIDYPSIRFGLEMAMMDLQSKGSKIFFPTPFTEQNQPISINGLIWMGSPEFMNEQIEAKLKEGFTCLKMKIGAINFEEELAILKSIRKRFSPSEIELRVDANGAFDPTDALEKLKVLSEFDLHSIEQPIKQGQWQEMAALCEATPIPIALDEELIGVNQIAEKGRMLETIKPQYLILKPSLTGGFQASEEWIKAANAQEIPWWATSALESNIGLNAISQWIATFDNPMPQGLGTGQLYTNNIPSPLVVEQGSLYYGLNSDWNLSPLLNHD